MSRMRTSSAAVRHRRGLSLVEVLICVAIGSMLLLSVGVAFNGSFNSYKDAQQRGHMLNDARGFMSRITSDIRMCDSAAPYDSVAAVWNSEVSQFATGQVPGNPTSGPAGSGVLGIQLTKTHADSWDPLASQANPILITYWFDPATNKVWMTRKMGSGAPTPLSACSYVQSFQIFMQPFKGTGYLQSASITMTLANKDATGARILSDGGQDLTLTFSDSAAPRRPYPGYTNPPF